MEYGWRCIYIYDISTQTHTLIIEQLMSISEAEHRFFKVEVDTNIRLLHVE